MSGQSRPESGLDGLICAEFTLDSGLYSDVLNLLDSSLCIFGSVAWHGQESWTGDGTHLAGTSPPLGHSLVQIALHEVEGLVSLSSLYRLSLSLSPSKVPPKIANR